MKPQKFSPSLFIIILILATIFLSSCRAPKELEYRDFKNFSIGNVGFTASTVRMDLVYYNPNNFGLQLKNTELDIYINGTFLGHSSQEIQITIPKREEFYLPISVDVDMKNIFKNAFTTLFNTEVTVKITGKLKVGKANVFMGMPVNYEGKQKFTLL